MPSTQQTRRDERLAEEKVRNAEAFLTLGASREQVAKALGLTLAVVASIDLGEHPRQLQRLAERGAKSKRRASHA